MRTITKSKFMDKERTTDLGKMTRIRTMESLMQTRRLTLGRQLTIEQPGFISAVLHGQPLVIINNRSKYNQLKPSAWTEMLNEDMKELQKATVECKANEEWNANYI